MPSSREFNVPPVIFPNPGPQQRRAPSTPFQPQTMPQSRPPNPNPNPNLPFMSFDMSSASASSSSSSHFSAPIYGNPTFEDDLPLLEELGINTRQIYRETQSILNPFKSNPSFFDDGDLSGPFLYLLLFGLFQLLAGKLHFGIILGWISVSACFIYVAFNMLAGSNGTLTLYTCLSLVGYGFVPGFLLVLLLMGKSIEDWWLMLVAWCICYSLCWFCSDGAEDLDLDLYFWNLPTYGHPLSRVHWEFVFPVFQLWPSLFHFLGE
ncbi:protein YIPF7 isoform X1 [Amborella trichopoda]|uniref:protein YIPF7 isoform X1 n=1 Tax=Amborella trichopoda TaxID=13333 RepID=UPI0005D2F56C|nr:protein YIPF7 isoform X1 [Amborella trichopoda]|eukprot:XP_020526479.1 protein YIPF7 isoform X1 [Amborella trichopoda]